MLMSPGIWHWACCQQQWRVLVEGYHRYGQQRADQALAIAQHMAADDERIVAVGKTSAPIDAATLALCDVLWIDEPEAASVPFTAAEAAAVKTWLEESRTRRLVYSREWGAEADNAFLAAIGSGVRYGDYDNTGTYWLRKIDHPLLTDVGEWFGGVNGTELDISVGTAVAVAAIDTSGSVVIAEDDIGEYRSGLFCSTGGSRVVCGEIVIFTYAYRYIATPSTDNLAEYQFLKNTITVWNYYDRCI